MVKSCCIESCKVTGEGAEYFKFPVSKALRASWVAAVGVAGDAVCAAHFTDDDYKLMRGKRRLRATAVPSLLLHKIIPSESEKEITEAINATEINSTNKEENSTSKEENRTNKDEKPDASQNKPVNDGSIDNNTSETTDKKDAIEQGKSEEITGGVEKQAAVKENGDNASSKNDIQNEEKDIEDMITNYQIKQTKSLADTHAQPLEDLVPTILLDDSKEDHPVGPTPPRLDGQLITKLAQKLDSQLASRLASKLASRLDAQLGGNPAGTQIGVEAEPVFIEVSADKAGNSIDSRPCSPQDCLMLLESVQCDIDPASLMLPEHDTDSDMEVIEPVTHITENADPISLLTSSDEDEVIIEEPDIDTVEVSDETDEDDRPLQALIKTKPKPKPPVEKEKQSTWGMYDFYCVQCDFRTADSAEFKKHNLEIVHSRALQICPTCGYTTASKAQFSRHKRKHKDERNFKCHLCNYKARHSMSLMYHLKSHNSPAERRAKFTCDRCGFYSDEKKEGLNHIRTCNDGGRLSCDLCSYSTKRRSDLKRHRMRRHSIDDNDEDFSI